MKFIPLTKGKQAIVDDEDYDFLNQFSWYYSPCGRGYAMTTMGKRPNRKCIAMHRLLIQPSKDRFTDHINGDGLDNRRENLRLCTPAQNQMNRRPHSDSVSGLKGVYSVNSKRNPWRASIQIKGHTINLGSFSTKEQAAKMYNVAAMHYFGEFAYANKML